MIEFLKKINPYFVLFLAVVFGYWQVSFLVYPLKWDAIDVVFPFRYYFSECIQSGYFPFWNPYQQTGTPFFADLQAPVFYPELLFTSLFTGYGVFTMQFLFVFYAFISAVGMYKLSYHFNQDRNASLVAGIVYSLSGYIVGHGQHFFLLVGAAWIPFVVVNYIELHKKRSLIQILKTALFIFLMVSGAYQALSFTLFYLLLLLFLFFAGKELLKKDFRAFIKVIKVNLYLSLIVVILLLPLIISTFEIINSVDRLGSGVALSQTINYGQNIYSLISFILPFSVLNGSDFFSGMDMSMLNHYFGLIPLIFFIASLWYRRYTLEYIILGFGIIILASVFRFLPVREFMFQYIPFMNLFKYAAFIRIFGLLAFILIMANYFAYFRKNIDKEKNRVAVLGILILVVLLFFIFYSSGKLTAGEIKNIFSQQNWGKLISRIPLFQRIFFQAIFQFIIVSVFLAIILLHKKIKHPIFMISFLLVVEIVTASQLNMASTVVDKEHKPGRMKKDLSLYPKKFPIPVNDKIIYNDNTHVSFSPFWRNTYIFSKQVSFNSFSSFELNSYSKLDDDFPNLRNAALNNHLFYFSDTISCVNQLNDSNIHSKKNSKLLFFSEKNYVNLVNKKVATNSSDEAKITEFSPNKVTIKTSTKNDQFITMLQTNFKGWKAYLDDTPATIYTSNFNYRTIFLPRGNHIVRYEYRNNKIVVLYIVSNAFFFLSVLFLLGYSIRKKNAGGKIFILIPAAVFLFTVFFLVKRLAYNDKNLHVNEIYKEHWSAKKTLFHYQNDFEDTQGGNNLKVDAENEYVNFASVENNGFKSGTLWVKFKIFPESYVEALIVSDSPGEGSANKWHAAKIERQIENTGKWNEIIYTRNFYDLKEGDVMNVYLWNLNQFNFRIDDLTVDFYP